MAKYGYKFESEFVEKDANSNVSKVRPLFGGDTESALEYGGSQQSWDKGAIKFNRSNNGGLRACADNVPRLIRKQILPNGAQGQNPSGGWTCTGLFKLANGNWLVGNDGRTGGSDTTFDCSIIELSFDCKTIENEFPMSSIVGNNSVQGVIEANDGSYWVCSPNVGSIHNIDSTTGAEISGFSVTGANGLAYDPVNNNLLWCSSSSSTIHIYSIDTASEIGTFSITSSNPDHICYSNGALFVTVGNNGEEGQVQVYDVSNGVFIGRLLRLPSSEAIEGIAVSNDTIVIAHDGGFHLNAYPARNLFMTYKFNNIYPGRTRFLGIHGKLTLNSGAPSDREYIVSQGKPYLSSTPGYGWAAYIVNTNELRLQIRDGGGSINFFVEYAITRNVEFTFDIYVDIDTQTVYCEIDGVNQGAPVTTSRPISDLTSDMNIPFLLLGVSREASPAQFPLNADVKNVFVSTTLADFNALKAVNNGDDNVISDLPITLTGPNAAPDGRYKTTVFDEYGNELLATDVDVKNNSAIAHGVVSAPGNLIKGFIIDNESPHSDGTAITGATV